MLGTGMSNYSEPGIYSQDIVLEKRLETIKVRTVAILALMRSADPRCRPTQSATLGQNLSLSLVLAQSEWSSLLNCLSSFQAKTSRFASQEYGCCPFIFDNADPMHVQDVLMEFPEKARAMCREWLVSHNCRLRAGVKVDATSLTTTAIGHQITLVGSEERLEADVIALCLGSNGETPGFVAASPVLAKMVDEHGRLPVNTQFQLLSHANIFVCGDCCSHPSVATKTAQMANWGGIQVAQSIAQALASTAMLTRARVAMRWPALLLRNPQSWPSLYVVSLGPHHGLLIINGVVLPTSLGLRMASFAKDFIEATKVMESRGSWFGLGLWQFGDSAACMVDVLGL